MKKFGLFLFAVLMMTGIAACGGGGGGGGDDDYNFNGAWVSTYVTVQSNAPSVTYVGEVTTGPVRITQNGNAITLQLGTLTPFSGSCDTRAKTFSASGVSGNGVSHILTGRAEDDDTLSGEHLWGIGPYLIKETFTMQLGSRAIGSVESGASAAADSADGSDEGTLKSEFSKMR